MIYLSSIEPSGFFGYSGLAAREALKDSGITAENTDFNKIGTYVSSGIAGLTTIQEQCEIYATKGNTRV